MSATTALETVNTLEGRLAKAAALNQSRRHPPRMTPLTECYPTNATGKILPNTPLDDKMEGRMRSLNVSSGSKCSGMKGEPYTKSLVVPVEGKNLIPPKADVGPKSMYLSECFRLWMKAICSYIDPKLHNPGSFHVRYEAYEFVDLPCPQKRGIYIPCGSRIKLGDSRKVVLTEKYLQDISVREELIMPQDMSPYAKFPDGIYISESYYIKREQKIRQKWKGEPVKVNIPSDVAERNDRVNKEDKKLLVLPWSTIIIVCARQVKFVVVSSETFQKGVSKRDCWYKHLIGQSVRKEENAEIPDLEIMRGEEVYKPWKKTRWLAKGINEFQVPKGPMKLPYGTSGKEFMEWVLD